MIIMPSTCYHSHDLNLKLKIAAETEAAMTIFANDLSSSLPHFMGARLGICSIVSDIDHFKHEIFSMFTLCWNHIGFVYQLVHHNSIRILPTRLPERDKCLVKRCICGGSIKHGERSSWFDNEIIQVLCALNGTEDHAFLVFCLFIYQHLFPYSFQSSIN